MPTSKISRPKPIPKKQRERIERVKKELDKQFEVQKFYLKQSSKITAEDLKITIISPED